MSIQIERKTPDPVGEEIPEISPYFFFAVPAVAGIGTWFWLEWGWAVVFEAGLTFCL